jgi:hypothetical protein
MRLMSVDVVRHVDLCYCLRLPHGAGVCRRPTTRAGARESADWIYMRFGDVLNLFGPPLA